MDVKYVRKVRQLHFVGQIIFVKDSMKSCEVRFVRKVTDSDQVFKWPDYVDEDFVSFDDIVTILHEPSVDRRGHVVFQHQFQGLNIQ